MFEYNLPTSVDVIDDLVAQAEAGETIELLRDGTTVAVIIGVDDFDDLVAGVR